MKDNNILISDLVNDHREITKEDVIKQLESLIEHLKSGKYPQIMYATILPRDKQIVDSPSLVTEFKFSLSYPWPG